MSKSSALDFFDGHLYVCAQLSDNLGIGPPDKGPAQSFLPVTDQTWWDTEEEALQWVNDLLVHVGRGLLNEETHTWHLRACELIMKMPLAENSNGSRTPFGLDAPNDLLDRVARYCKSTGRFMYQQIFRIPSNCCITHSDTQLLIPSQEGTLVQLISIDPGASSMSDARLLALEGAYFHTFDDAKVAGLRARDALAIHAVENRMGAVLGAQPLAEQKLYGATLAPGGTPQDSDLPRISSRPLVPGLGVVHLDYAMSYDIAGGFSESMHVIPHDFHQKSLATCIARGVELGERLRTAFELYAASFFDPECSVSRFLTQMIAVEAMLSPKTRTGAAAAHVQTLIEKTNEANLPTTDRASILGSLEWLRSDSIRATGMQLAKALLPRTKYMGKPADRFFDYCYRVRSKLVHEGKRDAFEEENAGYRLGQFDVYVRDLLLAAIQQQGSCVGEARS